MNPKTHKMYSLKQLADFYEVDYRTLEKQFESFSDELGERIGRFYTIAQLQVILKHLGTPPKLSKDQNPKKRL